MKKIMFNDKYGLTQAVLDGRKTMTRRFINGDYTSVILSEGKCLGVIDNEKEYVRLIPKYEVDEVVAIAQNYKDMGYAPDSLDRDPKDLGIRGFMQHNAGWNNKMFVLAASCKHHIRITNIRIERLQDISDDDCLKEGIIHAYTDNDGTKIYHTPHTKRGYLSTDVAQQAFAVLIDNISGKGTWERNPYVWAYEFELID